jgi:phosphoglycolate phosphatase-like HAD superfamily hydrolase
MAFKLLNPDYEKSPFTGMTWEHWAEAGKSGVGGECCIEKREVASGVTALIAASGNNQVALVAAQGWETVDAIREAGLHPDTPESVLLTASSRAAARYGGEPLRISVMLHRKGGTPWSDAELWPFPGVMDVLKMGKGNADMIVVSQTPLEALEREWKENNMTPYVRLIAGQEHGTKTEHIRFATEGKGYRKDCVLMVGDAPGDYKAARESGALFYPINPGDEQESWRNLHKVGLDRFLGGTYAGAYEEALIAEFENRLPEYPVNGRDFRTL